MLDSFAISHILLQEYRHFVKMKIVFLLLALALHQVLSQGNSISGIYRAGTYACSSLIYRVLSLFLLRVRLFRIRC